MCILAVLVDRSLRCVEVSNCLLDGWYIDGITAGYGLETWGIRPKMNGIMGDKTGCGLDTVG